MYKFLYGIVIFLLWLPAYAHSDDLVEHQLQVVISPGKGMITVTDRIRLPKQLAGETVTFRLHPALTIRKTGGGQLTTESPGLHTITLPPRQRDLTLEYQGQIRHALTDISNAAGKAQHSTRGWIGAEGVFLSGASAWYPQIDNHRLRIDLQVELPNGWYAISQGEASSKQPNHWRETQPQEEIYLIAGKYHRYASSDGPTTALVYLRQPDEALAKRYLAATQRYIALYNELLGDYPYRKFALVENFWESGYGMPSFTLLGPTVIRLPFIIHTSYPHEILHNWFGNGVYVDWSRGNWSEGLTTYLADHLLREQQGTAAAYRRDTLKTWADHVRAGNDFPLTAFRGRHGDASQAVGYGKAMMFFHMVRKRLGDKPFFAGLKQFYSDQRFKPASYDDLRDHWEQAANTDLHSFFKQWLTRTGAPKLALNNLEVKSDNGQFLLTATLQQIQQEAPFPLLVPLRISFVDGHEPQTQLIDMTSRSQPIHLAFPSRPARIDVDPEYDCFRHLYPEENPLTLSAVFGSDDVTIVLSADADKALLQGYRTLAEQWQAKRAGKWTITTDRQLATLPKHGAVILLGWKNLFRKPLFAQYHERISNQDDHLRLGTEPVNHANDSIALMLPGKEQQPILIIASDTAAALPGLTRKLPHYGKYSLLIFTGESPDIRHKQQWESTASPLSRTIL